MRSVAAPAEFETIDWIRRRIRRDPRAIIGVGDDAAVVQLPTDTLVTVDMLLEGVHFDLATASAADVGRKAINVNLSDIAAMAGEPLMAVVAIALPTGAPPDLPRRLFHGIQTAADRFRVALVGGDTNRSPAGLVVSVTLLGRPTGNGAVLRSGAKPGDALCVTGRLGYSLAGRHLHFTPRVREAQRLHQQFRLSAMMDLSDGLGSDLFHLTDESGVGAEISADTLPVADGPEDSRPPLDHALNDGEDFELLFSLRAADAARALAEQPLANLGVAISRIGTITAERTILLRRNGVLQPLPRGGYVHAW